MYKLLLCWRYLRTRYLALVCIVSVMLGVATLIVVNSVMGGFSSKLRERLHGLLCDIVVETDDMSGFPSPQEKMDLIRSDPELNDKIEAMAATMETVAMLQFASNATFMKPVKVIGVEPESRARLGGFQEFLVSERNRKDVSKVFQLDEEALRRLQDNRRTQGAVEEMGSLDAFPDPNEGPPPLPEGLPIPDFQPKNPALVKPPVRTAHVERCAVVGHAIAHYREPSASGGQAELVRTLFPGDEIILVTVKGTRTEQGMTAKPAPASGRFVVSDYIKTEMSEYDSNYIYVSLAELQSMRNLKDEVTAIQIKLYDYADAKFVKKRLQQLFEPMRLRVNTWEDKQGALLAAIRIEKGILNVLLFLIIAVAGFGILAIFSMIVVEKTRDIGILKALGASNSGVMRIFLGYGLLLGLVGAGLGTLLGLAIARNINEIETFISSFTGQQVFDRNIYYFDEIPVDIQTVGVLLINLGAVAIAVMFSILPALRAAMLHPVRALRFE